MAKDLEKKKAKEEAKAARRANKAERRQHRRKAQAVLSREDIADQLRALASQIESGAVVLGDKELELPAQADFAIAYQVKRRGGHQLEVEIEWGRSEAVSLLPTD